MLLTSWFRGYRAASPLLGLTGLLFAGNIAALELKSPSGGLAGRVEINPSGRLVWSLQRGDVILVEESSLGILVEGTDLGHGARIGESQVRTVEEQYAWRGVKRMATNHCNAYQVSITGDGMPGWTLEARVFDDAFAYRYRVPGTRTRRVTGEASAWTLPARAQVWFQTNTGDYEGNYQAASAEDLPLELADEKGARRPVFFGPPVTVVVPGGGFLLLSEADLRNYSGMTLRPAGNRRLVAAFEDDPEGFLVDGEIRSPWRVTIAAPDLNALVNTDAMPNLCPPPDAELFPQGPWTDWIATGRALDTWCVFFNDGAQWPLQKWFVDRCAAMRCEFLLVDAGWRTERWGWTANGGDVWERLRELCGYAASRGVGIILWHAWPEGREDGPGLTRPEVRDEFFRRCAEAGVKGVKIDFFNSESRGIVETYEALARQSALHRLSINFHGAHKPAGEVRTWPNEITREGIREQEYLLWEQLPLTHYAALPFTRMVVGHSDFLPAYVRPKFLKNTSATFQMATAVIATSSFITWPDHPDAYLASPFLGLLQSLPLAWDETVVLPGSEIGGALAFARRAGKDWYVAGLNGAREERSMEVPISLLKGASFLGTVYQDQEPFPNGVAIETGRALGPGDRVQFQMRPGGGFVLWLRPAPEAAP